MMGNKFPYQFERSSPIPEWLSPDAIRAKALQELLSLPDVDARAFGDAIAFKRGLTNIQFRRWKDRSRWPPAVPISGTIRVEESGRRLTMTYNISNGLALIAACTLGLAVWLAITGTNLAIAGLALILWLYVAWFYIPQSAQRFLDQVTASPKP